MVFKLFKKHCEICGMKTDKGKLIKKSDKYFCSKEHVEKYKQEMNTVDIKGKGCCGGHQ